MLYRRLEDLPVQTLGFRAPEIAFGDRDFGPPAEVFSLGILIVSLAGCQGFRLPANAISIEGWRKVLLKQLGAPVASEITNLPHYPVDPPVGPAKPLGDAARAALGPEGEALAFGCLRWAPSDRLTCKDILAHAFMQGNALVLGGVTQVWDPTGSFNSAAELIHPGCFYGVWRCTGGRECLQYVFGVGPASTSGRGDPRFPRHRSIPSNSLPCSPFSPGRSHLKSVAGPARVGSR